MKKTILLLLLFIIISCSNNDELPEEGISAESIAFLHNDNFKNWKITHYYTNYEEKVLDEDLTKCMQDDVYTFFSDKKEGEVQFGENSCYKNYNDVAGESALASYEYSSENRKLDLYFGRGAYSTENKVQTAWSISTSCELMTQDKMIFSDKTDGSGIKIIFERID